MSLLSQMGRYWRRAWGLREFLREPITLEQGAELIKQGIANREQNLLAMVKKAIYEREDSPYLKLLKLVGCQYGDFERMVRSDGIEPTLHKLRGEGVYLSYEEFKREKEVVRRGQSFRFQQSEFDNPFLVPHLEFRSSASRSSGTRVLMDLDRYRYFAAYTRATYAANGLWGSPVLLWLPIFPSAAWLVTMLRLAKMGHPPIRWFSQVRTGAVKPSLMKRLATYYTVYAGRLFGTAFPKPEYAGLERAYEVASYMAELLKKGQGCILETYTNSAIRVCQAARERKLDLSGATFVVGGEPLTEAKSKEVRAVGAAAVTMYGAAEIGLIGFGCANPTVADDVHLFMDSQVVIQYPRKIPFGGVEVDAFLFTSLLPKASKILLNVESGDYGVLETRHCGCGLEELGLTQHISQIRGFDKLTGEGMTFIGTDLLRIIEEILPAKFGGASTDYQMMEEEDEQSHTRLTILVDPEIGEIDERALIQTVLSELSKGMDTRRVMTEIWAQAGTLRVKRMPPVVTAGGKLLPLHIHRGR